MCSFGGDCSSGGKAGCTVSERLRVQIPFVSVCTSGRGDPPLSLYCSPLMALTVKVCESSSLGEMTAPANGSIPRGFWGRDCSLTKYSSRPCSLFKTKNLEVTTTEDVSRAARQRTPPHRPSRHYLNGIKVDYNNELVLTGADGGVASSHFFTPQWDTVENRVDTHWRTYLYCQPVTRLVYFIK